MNVRLISICTPVIDECRTPGELIAYCARVSNPANQTNHETSGRLIQYLMRHKHWSPFEMASMCVEITTTRDIARQILRHRSFSFQEFSQRYSEAARFTSREARLQDAKNRQSSIDTDDAELREWWATAQWNVASAAKIMYQTAIDKGIAKEVARAVLPEGLTESRLYMHGTVRSWIHYCDVRCDPSTQKEHREIAIACREILFQRFPDIKESMNA